MSTFAVAKTNVVDMVNMVETIDPSHHDRRLNKVMGLSAESKTSATHGNMYQRKKETYSSLHSDNGEEGPSHDGASARRSKTSNPRGVDVTEKFFAEFFKHLLIQEDPEDLPKTSKLAKACSEHFGGTDFHVDELAVILSLARMVPYGDRIRLTTYLYGCLSSYHPLSPCLLYTSDAADEV